MCWCCLFEPGDAAVNNLEQHLASLIPTAAVPASDGSPGDPHKTLSAAMQRRIHHNIQLAARCARLEAQKQALEAEKAALNNKLDKAQVRTATVRCHSVSRVRLIVPGILSPTEQPSDVQTPPEQGSCRTSAWRQHTQRGGTITAAS
jgi:hypothetical protein